MKLEIYNVDGSGSGEEISLNQAIFQSEPKETLIYEDVRRILANKRQGTAKTKERSEVRGGGKKAYKQKGTGMARRGSTRSPLLKGGGTVFGPEPRNYQVRMTRKMKQSARRSVLSLKARAEAITVVEDFNYDQPATRQMANLLGAFELEGKKVLLLTASTDLNIYKSGRNIPGVEVREANRANTYEILNADHLLIQAGGLKVLEESFNVTEEDAA